MDWAARRTCVRTEAPRLLPVPALPSSQSHPKFKNVADVAPLLYSRALQVRRSGGLLAAPHA